MDVLGFVLAGLSVALFGWRRRAARDREIRGLLGTVDSDAEIALHVANHAATSRGQPLAPIHVVYGLLQDATFVAALTELGGDAAKLEDLVLDDLDQLGAGAEPATPAIVTARFLAHHHGRPASCADLWQILLGTTAAQRVASVGVTPVALSFALIHRGYGARASLAGERFVHVVLRNDDYTTFEFVATVLHEVFELTDEAARAIAMATHHDGRAIVGRFDGEAAKAKVELAWARAREHGFPLWIGVEAC